MGLMNAALVRIAVEADASGVTSGLAPAAASMRGFEKNTLKSLATMKSAFADLNKGAKLGIAVLSIMALGAAFKVALGPAIEFQAAFAGVLKTVDGTPEQLEGIRTGLLGLSRVMPTTATELADIAANAGQLGVAAPDVLKFTETIARLGETTDLDFDTASASLARFANVTGLNVGNVERIADVIVQLGNNMATTESQIVTFAGRLAGAGVTVGLPEEDIIGLAAAYSSLGVAAERGGSALSRILLDMHSAALTGGDDLRVMAETANMTTEAFKQLALTDPAAALLAFERGLEGVITTGGNVSPILDELGWGGIRVSEVLLLGANGADTLADSLKMSSKEMQTGGAAMEEYAKYTATAAAQWEVFKGKISFAAIAAGTPALATFTNSVVAAGDALEFLGETFGPSLSEIGEALGNVGGLFADLMSIFGSPVLATVGVLMIGIATGVNGIFSAINALGPILGGAVGMMGLFAAEVFFVGPASVVAAKGVTGLTASVTRLQIAMSGPMAVAFIAAAVVIGSVGYALHEAGEHAKEAGDKIRGDFNSALDMGNYSSALEQLEAVSQRIEDINEIDRVPDGIATSWDGWGQSIKSVAQVLTPLTENTIVNARAEQEELNRVVEESAGSMGIAGAQITDLDRGLMGLADRLGISKNEAGILMEEMGMMPAVADAGAMSTRQYEVALDGLTAAGQKTLAFQEMFLEVTGHTVADMKDGVVNLEDYARGWDMTGDSLDYVAGMVDGFDLGDLLDPETAIAASLAFQQVTDRIEDMASSAGQSSDAFINQRAHSDALVASISELDAAIARVTDRQAALQQAMNGSIQAQLDYANAIEAGDIDGAAEAMGRYVAAIAATGAPVSEVTVAQAAMAAQIRAMGEDFGMTEGAINRLLAEYGLLSTAEIAEIRIEGIEVIDEAIVQVGQLLYGLDDLTSREYIAEIAADAGIAEEEFARALILGEEWAVALWEAEVGADFAQAEAIFNDALANGEEWANQIYEAVVGADATGALGETQLAAIAAELFASGDYKALLGLEGAAAVQTDIDNAVAAAHNYEGNYDAQIHADGASEASRELQDVARDVLAIPESRTVSVSVGYSNPGYSGSVNLSNFAKGGVVDYYADGGMRENHVAQIAPAGSMRVWAEAETGGESYIPLAPSKRARSLGIWRETGRRLGAMNFANGGLVDYYANGGVTGSSAGISASLPPIEVSVAVDTQGIAAMTVPLNGIRTQISQIGTAFGYVNEEAGRMGDKIWGVFVDVSTAAQETGRAMATSLRPEVFLEQFSRISGWAKDSFQDWLGDWDGTVESAVAKLDEAGIEIGHIWDGFGAMAADAGRSMALGMDPEPFLNNFTRISGWAKESFVDWLGEWDGSVESAVAKLEAGGIEMGHIWDGFADMAESAGRDMALSLKPDQFIEQFSAISGWAQDSFREWLGAWDGSVESAVAKLEGAGIEMSHIWDAFEDVTVETGRNMVEVFTAAGVDISAAAADMGADMVAAMDGDQFVAVFERISGIGVDSFEGLTEAWDGTTKDLVRLLDAAGVDLGEIFTQIFVETADDMQVFEAGMESAAVAVDGLDDSVRTLRDAMDLLNGGYLDHLSAQNDVTIGTDRLDEALKNLKEDAESTDADMAKFSDTLIRTGESYVDLALSAAETGLGMDEVNRIMAEGEKTLRDAATAAGFTAEEVDALVAALFEIPPEIITEIALEGEQANADIEAVKEALIEVDEAEIVAEIGADTAVATEAIVVIVKVADDFTEADHTATVSTDTVEGTRGIVDIESAANKYKDGSYIGVMGSDTTVGTNAIATIEGAANKYKDGSYVGVMEANNAPATRDIAGAETKATGYARTYTSTLTSVDNASGTIGAVIRKLGGFVSKSITLTTNSVTKYSSQGNNSAGVPNLAALATGGYLNNASALRPLKFAAGGDVAQGHMPEWGDGRVTRMWNEPETQGESYIPHANDWRRPRAVQILNRTAERFGMRLETYAAGGYRGGGFVGAGTSGGPSIFIAPGAIPISIEGSNLDEAALQRVAGKAVQDGLTKWTRDVSRGLSLAR